MMEVFRIEAMELDNAKWAWVLIGGEGTPRWRGTSEWESADEALEVGILAIRGALVTIARKQAAVERLLTVIFDEPEAVAGA